MDISVLEKVKTSFRVLPAEPGRPRMRTVVLLNDDYTPMEFVVDMLVGVFDMDDQRATRVMLQIHYQGRGVCGQYPTDIAETKVSQVISKANSEGFPLLCRTEIM